MGSPIDAIETCQGISNDNNRQQWDFPDLPEKYIWEVPLMS
jgi:hypothetical protein